MESPEFPSSEREQRFTEVLTEYLEALESGQPDDRAALLMRFSDLADDLRGFFAREDQLQELATPLRRATGVSTLFAGAPRGAAATFPKVPAEQFRIVREVGHGGMGVVYEAVELSLDRRVALKVLRPQSQSDPRALQRFLREARIVARLHHTNIVPIFQVGEHDGLHYFAMEFIDGRGLDRVLHERRDGPTRPLYAETTPPLTDDQAAPTGQAVGPDSGVLPEAKDGKDNGSVSCAANRYQEAARIGVQVAEALAHAHEHGILHRDVKPSNLLLDRAGTIWVTDFGLAKEGQEDLTDPGEVVGTLRYLAPERFSGQVDARGDVYSLGATLYELLTLRPVHDELDRAELMARVLRDEPVRPRQIDGRIPRDLETIVLKALAKEPAGRYPTARALADDLRRFLDDVPIQARRASILERGWRLCRRNPGIAMACSAAVMALLIGLGVALWQWHRADEAARRAEANATQAKQDFELAFQAIDQMLERVGGQHLVLVPHLDQTRRALLEDAVRFYQDLLRGKESHPESRFALARACHRLGELLAALNDLPEALRYQNAALALAELLLADDPNHVEYRHLVACVYVHRGVVKRTQRQADAEADSREALARLESLSAECPDRPHIVFSHAYALLEASEFTRTTSRLAEREPLLRRCVAVAEKLPTTYRYRSWLLALASGLRDLALVLEGKGRLRESDDVHQRAQELFNQAARHSPEMVSRYELATSFKNQARFQVRSAKPTEAEKLYRQSIEISERLVADFPDSPFYRFALADASNELGALLGGQGRTREAETVLERSVSDWKDLVGRFPDRLDYRVRLAATLNNLALRRARGDVSGAQALLEEAIEQQEKVATVSPEQDQTLEFLSNHYRALADVLVKLGHPQQADEAISRQRALAQQLADKDGKSAVIRVFQARTCENLVHLRLITNRPGDAEEAYGEAIRHWRKLVTDFPDDPSHASRLGAALNDCAVILLKQRRWAEVISLLDEAIRVQEAAVRARPDVPSYQQFLYSHCSNRAEARLGLGDHAEVFSTSAQLHQRFPDRFGDYLWAARLARCIPLAKKDSSLTEERRDKLQQQYADESMALLRAALQKQAKDLPQIHVNPAFEPLRERADFQRLLTEVAKPANATK